MRRGYAGQITVFLSLTLMLLISFLCTALRSAQTAGSRYLFTLASEAVTRSMFGAYDTRAWEQYRILMLTDRELAHEIGRECAASYQDNGTLFPLEITTVQLVESMSVAENGAYGWEQAAVSYMETRLPVDLASRLMEQIGLVDGLEDVTQWFSGLKDLLKPLLELEKKLCRLEEKLSEAVEAYQRGKQLLSELHDGCEAVKQVVAVSPVHTADFDAAWSSLEQSYQEIQEYLKDSGWELEELASDASEDLRAAVSLESRIRQLIDTLAHGDDWGLASLADLGGYLTGLTDRFDFLQNLPGQLSQQMDHLHQVSQMTLPPVDEVLSGAGVESMSLLQELAEGFAAEDWDPDHLTVEEGAEADAEKAGILLRLKEWVDQGILYLVLEDSGQVSQASLQRTLVRSQRQDSAGLLDAAYRNLLYGEYALRYTDDYSQCAGDGHDGDGGSHGDDGETGDSRMGSFGLCYETEYLIAGKETDQANLSAVASRLLLTRGVLNFVYLLQNYGNNESLHVAAAGISAALGGWIPEGLMAVLMMVIWSMAEAVCDVRALLAGRQIPFWKDAASWQLAFEHLWTVWEDGFVMGMDRLEGMSYEEYLRLLLFLVPVEEKCYRTMEIAEENLRKEREDLQIDQAWYGGTVVVQGQAAGQEIQLRLQYGY